MINEGMFSSNTTEWETPSYIFKPLEQEFGITLDVCANPSNAKCAEFFTATTVPDTLERPWIGTCWMNPPYGRGIERWVEKAYTEALKGNATVVCLLPARTDTGWFHDFCKKGEIRFIRGRIQFYTPGQLSGNATFPSMVVIFRRAY